MRFEQSREGDEKESHMDLGGSFQAEEKVNTKSLSSMFDMSEK